MATNLAPFSPGQSATAGWHGITALQRHKKYFARKLIECFAHQRTRKDMKSVGENIRRTRKRNFMGHWGQYRSSTSYLSLSLSFLPPPPPPEARFDVAQLCFLNLPPKSVGWRHALDHTRTNAKSRIKMSIPHAVCRALCEAWNQSLSPFGDISDVTIFERRMLARVACRNQKGLIYPVPIKNACFASYGSCKNWTIDSVLHFRHIPWPRINLRFIQAHSWALGKTNEDDNITILTLSLPSSKSTFSQPFKEKCTSEIVRVVSIIISVSYEKPSSPYCAIERFWWGCRGNLILITLESERVKSAKRLHHSDGRANDKRREFYCSGVRISTVKIN